jgi:hypothetical protein
MKIFLLLFGVTIAVSPLLGCGRGNANSGPIPADTLAQSDPNAKARVLLDQFAALPPDEQGGWVQRRSIELTVFQTVTDPTLRARYETEIVPHLGTR